MNNVSRPHLLGMLAGLFLAMGLVLSTMLGAIAWLKVRHSQFIKVKGSARKNVKADLVIWRGSFRVEAATLLDAQRELKAQVAKVSQFVRDRGLTNLLFAPIGIEEVIATLKDAEGLTRQRNVGYRLSQMVRVESAVCGLGEEAFFLEHDEIIHLLGGQDEATSQIPIRKTAYQKFSALPEYPTIIVGRFDPFTWAAGPNRRRDIYDANQRIRKQLTNQIKGMPGSAGQAEGRVRIVHSPEEGYQLQPGEILVAVTTNVGWTPIFPRAAAIVTDVGAPLSHAAIVARELGIPAVVGCGNATMLRRSGDHVHVDGSAGTVELK